MGHDQFDGLVQDCTYSIAKALELPQSYVIAIEIVAASKFLLINTSKLLLDCKLQSSTQIDTSAAQITCLS